MKDDGSDSGGIVAERPMAREGDGGEVARRVRRF